MAQSSAAPSSRSSAEESNNTKSEQSAPTPSEPPAAASSSSWGLSTAFATWGGLGLTHPESPSGKQQDDGWKQGVAEVEDGVTAAMGTLSSYFGVAEEVEAGTGDTPAAPVGGGAVGGEGSGGEVEDVFQETAKLASNFFSGASTFLSGAVDTAVAESYPPTPAPDTASSNINANNDGDSDNTGNITKERPDALRQLLDLNPLNHLASHWIDDLERQSALADPHRALRSHLDVHLLDWPASTYEEWVEEALVSMDGWDGGSAVVDETFYGEGNVWRDLWNERMVLEDQNAGGEDNKKRYVLARKGQHEKSIGVAPAVCATAPEESGVVTKAGAALTSTKTVSSAIGASNEDDDLDGLLGEEGVKVSAPKSVPPTLKATHSKAKLASSAVPAAKSLTASSAVSSAAALLNDDADLDGLLGDDEELFL